MTVLQFPLPVFGEIELPCLLGEDGLYWDESPHMVAEWLEEVLGELRVLAIRAQHPKAFCDAEAQVFSLGFHPSSHWVRTLQDRMRTVSLFASAAPALWSKALALSRRILALHQEIFELLVQRDDPLSPPPRSRRSSDRADAGDQRDRTVFASTVAATTHSRSTRLRLRGHSRRRTNRGVAWRVPAVY